MIFSMARLPEFRKRLFAWFKIAQRELPWRRIPTDPDHSNDQDPYPVWISEIMLQQTTTAAVEEFFKRFMLRFPNVSTLANADRAEVLRMWEGLGYYRRADQLHRAAQEIMDKYKGSFPRHYREVLDLPGIGRYMAGAILSIAFDQRLPILEANTIRLHSRLIGLEEDPASRSGSKLLWDFAEKILPRKKVGIFNQILMDLGNMICTPKDPRCAECPLVSFCAAAQTGSQHLIPVPKRKAEKEHRTEVALLVRKNRKDRRFLLIKYPKGCRWAGLWDFPRFLQISDRLPNDDPDLRAKLEDLIGSIQTDSKRNDLQIGSVLTTIRHVVTRYHITLLFCDTIATRGSFSPVSVKKIEFAAGNVRPEDLDFLWTDPESAKDLPMSSTGRKLLNWID